MGAGPEDRHWGWNNPATGRFIAGIPSVSRAVQANHFRELSRHNLIGQRQDFGVAGAELKAWRGYSIRRSPGPV